MKIIDAHTAREVKVDDVVRDSRGENLKLVEVDDKSFFDVTVKVRHVRTGRTFWMPLTMRILHPSHFLRRVGFIET